MQGGTGAGPDVIMEHSGIPSLAAIVEADQALKEINLREDVSLVAAGGIRSGADLAKALALGADAVYIGGEAFGLRAKAKNFDFYRLQGLSNVL